MLADLEEHVDVLLLEVAAGLGYAVDGGEDFGFVAKLGGREGGEVGLFVLEVGVEVDEGGAVGLKDTVHALLLVGAEVELFDGLVVVPPAASEAEEKAEVRGFDGGDERGAVGSVLHAAAAGGAGAAAGAGAHEVVEGRDGAVSAGGRVAGGLLEVDRLRCCCGGDER